MLAAYAATAGAAGVYLASSTFLDTEVSEQVAVAAPAGRVMAAPPEPGAAPAAGRPRPANVRVRGGAFLAVRHPARGRATVIELARGGRVLTLTDFEVDNGPDLRVYLVAGASATESDVDDVVDLGALKGNRGDQQYRIPREVDVGHYATAVIWCRAFSVLFARAPLRR